MKLRSIITTYVLSPLSLIVLAVSAIGAAFLTLSGFITPVQAMVTGAVFYVAISAYLVVSPWGATAISGETARKRGLHDAEALLSAKKNRDALSFLRIQDGEVKRATQALLLASGRYLEEASRGSYRDPECEQAIAEARELVDTFLKGMDAEAAERHFGLNSDLDEADFKAKILDLLASRAELLSLRAAALAGELPPSDAVDIKKELS